MKKYTIQASIDELEKKVAAGGSGASAAENVTFDNTGSKLTATDVQSAIAELVSILDEYNTPVIDTNISNFSVANDTYTITKSGIAVVSANSQDANVAIRISNNDFMYVYENTDGRTGSLVIPVNAGDELKIINNSNVLVDAIGIYPVGAFEILTTVTKYRRKK